MRTLTRWILSLLLAAALLVMFIPTAMGGSVSGRYTVNGSIDATSGCYLETFPFYVYDATEFTPDVTGTYTISLSSVEPTAAWTYLSLIDRTRSTFDPMTDINTQGLIDTWDLGLTTITADLVGGHTYLMVLDTYQSYLTYEECIARTETLALSYVLDIVAPPAPPAANVPGCDMLISLPADAAVGTFVADAVAYWEPGKLTAPPIVITAGKSYWVVGMNADQTYYKIYLQCTPVWVLAETLGPNPDALWNNHPLPTTVVTSTGSSR